MEIIRSLFIDTWAAECTSTYMRTKRGRYKELICMNQRNS